MLPGDPFSGERKIPEATMQALKVKYGPDKPITVQFGIYLKNVLHGDLGVSIPDGRPIVDIIAQSFSVSFELGIQSLIFDFILGVLLGVVATVKRNTMRYVMQLCRLLQLWDRWLLQYLQVLL